MFSRGAIEIGHPTTLVLQSASNTIRDNVISHNLSIRGGASTGNVVQGNRIGTNPAGRLRSEPLRAGSAS